MSYITKDQSGLVQLWNNKPIYNKHSRIWFAWEEENRNEVGIDVTANDGLRELVDKEKSINLADFINEEVDSAKRNLAYAIHCLISKGATLNEVDEYACNMCNF